MKKIYDITIIGSGLTGLTIGLALSSLGYKIALVDPKPLFLKKDKHPDNRTTAISSGSVDFYKRIGIWKALNKEGHYNSSTSTLNNIQFSNIRFDVKNLHPVKQLYALLSSL